MTTGERLRTLASKLRGFRTSALVGKSGTGKSFRANLIAESHGVEIIIDDGLIIRDRTILYETSSKRESSMLSAVRRALFDEPESCAQARRTLRATRFHRALILGTSLEMVNRIAHNLGLPRPSEIFRIEDVASQDEIDAAWSRRKRKGAHSLPLPPVKVRMGLRSALGSWVRALAAAAALRRHRRVAPTALQSSEASTGDEVVFTESAIGQMVHHCIQEYDSELSLGKLLLTKRGTLHAMEIGIRLPFQRLTSGRLHDLRDYITRSLERYAGLLVEVTLVVETIEEKDSSPLKER